METSKKTTISKEKIEALKKEYKIYAKEKGFRLNPDNKVVETIIRLILENREKLGHGYCPCRRVTKNKKEDEKIICPCVFHKDEVETLGHCHCMLFVR
jgi:ferredoxin-thioredoxin reductase catalytic subunit